MTAALRSAGRAGGGRVSGSFIRAHRLNSSIPRKFSFKAKRGLSEEVVKEISWMKQEPEWMTKLRLRSLGIFRKKPMPTWGADLYGMTDGASGAATEQPALPQDPHVAVLGDLPLEHPAAGGDREKFPLSTRHSGSLGCTAM